MRLILFKESLYYMLAAICECVLAKGVILCMFVCMYIYIYVCADMSLFVFEIEMIFEISI